MFGLLSFSLMSISFLIMTDVPPNPEDGEQWLPSDVFHEIESCHDSEVDSPKSNSSTHQAAADEISVHDPFDHVGVDDSKREKAKSPEKLEETGRMDRTKLGFSNWPWQFINTRKFNNNIGSEQSGNKHRGGTGVFLPQHIRRHSMEAKLKIMSATGPGSCNGRPGIGTGFFMSGIGAGCIGGRSSCGTGVFINLNPLPPSHKRTKSCGVNMEKYNYSYNDKLKSNNPKRKESGEGKQHFAVKSDQTIHLPEEWIY